MEEFGPAMIIADQAGIAFMLCNNEVATVAVGFNSLAKPSGDRDAAFRVDRVERAPPEQCPSAHYKSRPKIAAGKCFLASESAANQFRIKL